MSRRARAVAAEPHTQDLNLTPLTIPLLAWSRARSLGYTLEARLMYLFSGLLPGAPPPEMAQGPLLGLVQSSMKALLEQDIARIEAGVYPMSVLTPGSPIDHLKRIPWILLDGARAHFRRTQGKTTIFSKSAREFLDELPRYYRRNFHFQTDGYLSERSAELYDHQVELLFGGTADAMRRLVIPHLKKRLENSVTDGPLRILEIGCGTGSATRFVRQAFPKARITATDLSGPYLKHAQRKLDAFDRIDYVQAAGESLPFQDGQFDAVFSVFLFHELPLETREAVLREARRVLKPGGPFALVDSIQKDDVPRFDELVANFSRDYHEPFYRCYVTNPLREIFSSAGYQEIEEEIAFVSKVISGVKA